MYDVAIIGAGVIGSFIARDLAKYQLNVILIEKDTDVANGTTKANSGIVHAGYNAKSGTLKATLNVKGNAMYDRVCRELDVPFKRIGSYVIAFDECDMDMLRELYHRGNRNGVNGLVLLSGKEAQKKEPQLSKDVIGALYAPSCGIISPYELTVALAENAVDNGVVLKLETEVVGIQQQQTHYVLNTMEDPIEAKCVVNAAGVYGDLVNNMVNQPVTQIIPRRGQYYVLDKTVAGELNHVIFQSPSEKGKGVVLVPTVHGNMLVGPDALYVEKRDNVETTIEGLDYIASTAKRSWPTLPMHQVIRSYAGVRATPSDGDFIIEESNEHKGFFNAIGIESPGLASAPAIAEKVVEMIENYLDGFTDKEFYNAHCRKRIRFADLSPEERTRVIQENPLYAVIACRCETVTEAEIVDAIHRNAGARTIDGIKRRVRAGMGRCQGGFCLPRIIKILARELEVDPLKIEKDKKGSYLLTSETKEP